VAWRSRFFSAWVLACVISATVTNPALWFLFYLFGGGKEDAANTWTLVAGTGIAWMELGAFLLVAVTVRLVQAVQPDSKQKT
jgi:hypothetical protein